MPKVSQSELKKQDKVVLRNSQNNEVASVIFPNGIQVGLDSQGFNKGIRLPNLSIAPSQTENILYVVDGDIFFNGVLAAPGGGTNLTIKSSGTSLTTKATSIDFSGIEATASGNDVTVTPDGEGQVLALQIFS